ncbi:tRNA pseudouridine synthase A [Methylobacterium sp. 4-46]|uniref:tRNA pseudouridine synthase A n=1 Tax=Methylobacterium sp. (strain 4-46) TaxID=426117 RepID=TRUA_METS4|nr:MULTISPECIES: tRNA pseudouridine(38-40) synthase TruA [Methylobacterium]B0UP40.1 RecName: Full=tRNA pseudouridine synthase A; AltName: Full=tRNA pseudouridine(38-40) synthase; AltName: Full=tRNA pseudouridylate synthase I; AltName: Full=tRNA-uridine isomerase I [Methylobacterium sp. 4-46]ACA18587.1 tRNA pseudouridine synthase A [Methylobacterium sp. 4-46]WFT77869.1 tRNA pseudouridine(38-40) synthase TruA [Methylobacterium nodulans]
MPRYKLVVEYDGSGFAGWQRQAADRTVQQALEEAIARFAGAPVRVHCAGRTDAGVHATHQVVHLDLDRDWRTDTVRDASNAHLRPEPVAVVSAERVRPDFDARHSALRRHYRYRILNRRSPPALGRAYLWHVPWSLDAHAMHAAAQTLLGRHDFSAFRAAECQANSPVRTLDQLDVARIGDEILVATSARSFLHHQVRGMVGTLMLAGCGRLDAAGVRAVLDSRDRTRCGPLAPAAGLTLTGVDYPEPGP